MSLPTDPERELIIKFRAQVSDILENDEQLSDPYLIRWIRARDGKLDKAESMLRNSLKWRKDNDTDSSLSKPVDTKFLQNFPFFINSYDHEGHPAWDFCKIVDQNKEKEFQQYATFLFESIMFQIKKSNDSKLKSEWPNTQQIVLADFQGFSYFQLINRKAVKILLEIASQYEAHYPEILFKAYFINCPAFMPIFMKLVKPFLATKTYAKFHVFGSNKEEYGAILRREIDPDVLSVRFGGNRV